MSCQDVTPLVIEKFINRPIIEAHVLLDSKGKTLSHAFVQLLHEDARTALRSTQNAILGQGRRARAVTVTLSSQEELMAAVWRSLKHKSASTNHRGQALSSLARKVSWRRPFPRWS